MKKEGLDPITTAIEAGGKLLDLAKEAIPSDELQLLRAQLNETGIRAGASLIAARKNDKAVNKRIKTLKKQIEAVEWALEKAESNRLPTEGIKEDFQRLLEAVGEVAAGQQ